MGLLLRWPWYFKFDMQSININQKAGSFSKMGRSWDRSESTENFTELYQIRLAGTFHQDRPTVRLRSGALNMVRWFVGNFSGRGTAAGPEICVRLFLRFVTWHYLKISEETERREKSEKEGKQNPRISFVYFIFCLFRVIKMVFSK